ncbi:MAG: uracil-DNA glycosylase [Euryarchaeota archaeon]|nr:uracil-DNA glycosylase [Euryarchaeota archaeon]MDE1835128.1 uracil-DNA glycosylase [Euryarchaeota archaeon]MDE1880686.1 uracil-DNA glycosylase [Euryarchaeota archaeon]MDE2044909.1 uracil-DNA glycosylase [Thermoplasmata archaeon]
MPELPVGNARRRILLRLLRPPAPTRRAPSRCRSRGSSAAGPSIPPVRRWIAGGERRLPSPALSTPVLQPERAGWEHELLPRQRGRGWCPRAGAVPELWRVQRSLAHPLQAVPAPAHDQRVGRAVPLRAAPLAADLETLDRAIERCRKCPRLVAFREKVSREGQARRGERYWARPITGFGDPTARLILVGLAPAAQGGNRTGRVFTGDRSAAFLMAALHRNGFANQPTSLRRDDGLELVDAYMTAAVRCVPPDNRPSPSEFQRCRPYLVQELGLLPRARVVLALGGGAWDQVRRASAEVYDVPRPREPFRHGLRVELPENAPILWASYHPSPRNVQTGLFSARMMDQLLAKVRRDLV